MNIMNIFNSWEIWKQVIFPCPALECPALDKTPTEKNANKPETLDWSDSVALGFFALYADDPGWAWGSIPGVPYAPLSDLERFPNKPETQEDGGMT